MITTESSAGALLPAMPSAPIASDDIKSTKTFDKALGARVKLVRNLRGISQERLAVKLGLTFQQVQKYETGANRFPIARLVRIAEILKCTVAFLIGESEADADELHLMTGLVGRKDVAVLLPRLIRKTPHQVRAINTLLDTMPDLPADAPSEQAGKGLDSRETELIELLSAHHGTLMTDDVRIARFSDDRGSTNDDTINRLIGTGHIEQVQIDEDMFSLRIRQH